MRRLLSSELLRFRSRRLVVVLLVGVLLATTVGLVIAAFDSTPPPDAVVASALARADREVADCLTTDWEREGVGVEGSLPDFCRRFFGDPTEYMPSHLALVDLPKVFEGVSSVTSILALIMGASVVAASWQTGTITTILTWEPRRLRWFAARILVIGAGVLAITIAILGFLAAGLAIAASLRGTTFGLDGRWWEDTLTTSLRVGVAATASAMIGGAVAAVGRHTSAALGVVFVWTAVLEGLIRGFRPLWSPWLLGDNLVSFLSWQTMEVQVSRFESYTVTPGRALFVILGYTAVTLALGFTFVRIRDVQ
jgi:ABC-2 type transport system permease protein